VKTISIFFVITTIILCDIAAQSGEWVEAEGVCNGANITPTEGWKRATEDARAKAIKDVVGVHITEEVYRNISETINEESSSIYDAFSKLSRSNSYGKIVEEEILDRQTLVENDIPVYKVSIRAKVVEDKGNVDPGFTAEIIMQKNVFYDRGRNKSDELKFDIWASKNCYIYLFNILSDDNVLLLIPNEFITNNYYSVDKDIQEFEKGLSNLSFTVGLPPGKDYVIEALYVVALKNKLDFISDNLTGGASGIIPTYQAAIADIQSWMIQVPRDQRTEAIKSFEIRKSE
jgi:hypothetical protein